LGPQRVNTKLTFVVFQEGLNVGSPAIIVKHVCDVSWIAQSTNVIDGLRTCVLRCQCKFINRHTEALTEPASLSSRHPSHRAKATSLVYSRHRKQAATPCHGHPWSHENSRTPLS
jgi:hypothetical protein